MSNHLNFLHLLPLPRTGVTKSEMVLWHHSYLDCCKELNQWDVVNEYAKVCGMCFFYKFST